MIKIDVPFEVTVKVPGCPKATYIFPPFRDMADTIERIQRRKLAFGEGGQIISRVNAELVEGFDARCTDVRGFNYRTPQGVVAALDNSGPGWRSQIPITAKLAAMEIYDDFASAEALDCEVYGDPTVVRVRAPMGTVDLTYQPSDSEAFQDAIRALVGERKATDNTAFYDRLDQRLSFHKAMCVSVTGIDCGTEEVPLNVIVSAVRVFERRQVLTSAEAGN